MKTAIQAPYRLSEIVLTSLERDIRANIRNAYLPESIGDLRQEAMSRAAQGKWFEACCLLELATEINE